jgi:hypothetical protein
MEIKMDKINSNNKNQPEDTVLLLEDNIEQKEPFLSRHKWFGYILVGSVVCTSIFVPTLGLVGAGMTLALFKKSNSNLPIDLPNNNFNPPLCNSPQEKIEEITAYYNVSNPYINADKEEHTYTYRNCTELVSKDLEKNPCDYYNMDNSFPFNKETPYKKTSDIKNTEIYIKASTSVKKRFLNSDGSYQENENEFNQLSLTRKKDGEECRILTSKDTTNPEYKFFGRYPELSSEIRIDCKNYNRDNFEPYCESCSKTFIQKSKNGETTESCIEL